MNRHASGRCSIALNSGIDKRGDKQQGDSDVVAVTLPTT